LSSFTHASRGATALWRRGALQWSRRIASALPIALVASTVAVAASPPSIAHAASASAACPSSRPDEGAALITARVCGGKVQIAGATTETSEAWALPSGQIERHIAAAPVRVRRDGAWTPIDLTLVELADGTVVPKADPNNLVLSGAQTTTSEHELATTGAGTRRVAMTWTGALPKPTLDGARATYADALPGVDLIVQATGAGAETFLTVKSRQAAGSVAAVPLGLAGAAVASYQRDAAGNVTLVDAGGKALAHSPAPEMWDAQTRPGDGEPVTTRTVAAKVLRRAALSSKPKKAIDGRGVDLALAPDKAFLADPATVFPVTIDPQINPVSTTFSTYVKQNDTVDRSGATDLELGVVSGNITRSFVHWDTTALEGKQITSASVYFWNWWSPTCTATSWEIWSTDQASSATRWTNQPAWNTKEATSTATKGFNSGCDDGLVSISGTSFFQRAATADSYRGFMGIRATSETDANSFKQFGSKWASDAAHVPYAVVNYNSYPVVGTRSTSPSSDCVTGADRPYINSVSPTLSAVITDAEGSAVKANFEWYDSAGTKIGSTTTAAAASGSSLSATVPSDPITNGSTYKWRVQGNDGSANGAWSSYCEFTVDMIPPAKPSVTSTTYPTNTSAGAAGTPGTFTFGPAGESDVASYVYGLDVNPPTTVVNAASVGGSANASITPTTNGAHTLYVKSRDRAGNTSPTYMAYTFTVGPDIGDITSPSAGDLSAGKVVLSGDGDTTSTGVTYQWRRGDADAWKTIPTSDVTAVSGGAAITWPFATTGNGKFSALTWNVESTVGTAEAGQIHATAHKPYTTPEALDGPLQVRASFTGGTAGVSSPSRFSLDRNRAAAPAVDMKVGSVNQLTGNLTVTAADAAVAGLGVGRAFNSRQAGDTDPMFGLGWISSVRVPTSTPYTSLSVTGSLVQIGLPDGSTFGFTKNAATSTGAAFNPAVGAEKYALEYFSSGDEYVLTDPDRNAITFTRRTGDPAGNYTPSSSTAAVSGDTSGTSWETATVGTGTVVRPTQVLAPIPAGVNCGTLVRGCKALRFTYATTTTATTVPGDYTGRIEEITYTAWDPQTAAMKTVVVTRYSYDNTGRLAAAWDPRLDWTDSAGTSHQLATVYTYDTDGILSTVTPPGQERWQLSYTTIPGDAGKGRLYQTRRSALTAGTAVQTVVYRVPVSGTGAPGDLSAAQTARWGQNAAPVDATAVFPATQVPDGDAASGQMPTSWTQAAVTYMDGNAREVNVRDATGGITTTWYDTFGHTVQELTAGNRDRALWFSATDAPAAEAALAANRSTMIRYSEDGKQVTETLGPEHDVVLSDWTAVRGRDHTRLTYDEGAPAADQPYNLVTTQRTSAQYGSGAVTEGETETKTYKYDWSLRLPTDETVDPTGLALTTRSGYDSSTGLATTSTLPSGEASGTTAATRTTVYYRVETGSGVAACDSHPEWAGLPCQVAPAGQPATGKALPTTTTTYDFYGSPAVVTESNSEGVLRTTTITYDNAGRPIKTSIDTSAGLGSALDTRTFVYDPATGFNTYSRAIDANGATAAEIRREYDSLGRLTAYTDADGVRSTMTYDIASRPQVATDGKASQAFTYDDRGLTKQLVDSQGGASTAAYDFDGNLVTETRPDGIKVNRYYNENQTATGIEYSKNGSTIYYDWLGITAQSRRMWDSSTFLISVFNYDAAGRLINAADHVGSSGCTQRHYGYDKNSNRTSLTPYGPDAAGNCQTKTAGGQKQWN
jgi:YD repeat-containing protein